MGAVAVMRGLFISVVALLYVLFVIGALLGKGWAWWACLTATVVNPRSECLSPRSTSDRSNHLVDDSGNFIILSLFTMARELRAA